MKSRLYTALAVAVGIAVGVGLTRATDALRTAAPRAVAQAAGTTRANPARHQLLDEVLGRIRRDYVVPLPDAAFEEAAVEGVVASLDPHSAFLDAEQYDEMRLMTAGSYSGVGIEVTADTGGVVVVTPIEGSPAALAGVRSGDLIIAVDDQPVTSDHLDDTINLMRGSAGSNVRLTIARTGEPEPLLFTLQRSEVHVHSVRSEALPGGYGYVRISQFSDSTPGDLEAALLKLVGNGPTPALRGLVLDLRGNPGGVLESAVSVADEFLEEGIIVRADGRTPEARFEMDASAGDLLAGRPIVVLVDGGSASGSEIVAGALRDHRRATLMGERTFGKGSVQTVIPLRDGQALKLTTSKYFTPSGTSIHDTGIEPDIVIAGPDASTERPEVPALPPSPSKDPAVQSALQYLRDRGLGAQYAAVRSALQKR